MLLDITINFGRMIKFTIYIIHKVTTNGDFWGD